MTVASGRGGGQTGRRRAVGPAGGSAGPGRTTAIPARAAWR